MNTTIPLLLVPKSLLNYGQTRSWPIPVHGRKSGLSILRKRRTATGTRSSAMAAWKASAAGLLIFRCDLEGKGLAVPERRAAVEAETPVAVGDFNRDGKTDLAFGTNF